MATCFILLDLTMAQYLFKAKKRNQIMPHKKYILRFQLPWLFQKMFSLLCRLNHHQVDGSLYIKVNVNQNREIIIVGLWFNLIQILWLIKIHPIKSKSFVINLARMENINWLLLEKLILEKFKVLLNQVMKLKFQQVGKLYIWRT